MSRKLLKELTLSITDGEHGTVSHDVDGVHLLLSAKNLVNGKVVVFSEERKISYTDFWKIRSRTKLEKDDVLLSTTGTIGNIAIATECEHFDFNRDVAMIKCDKRKILPEYLYYYLLMPSTQKRLMFRTKGGTQKHLYLADIEGFEIDLPDMVEQQKIVRFLRKIDDKIITNCRINDNLHQMLCDKFEYYFIQNIQNNWQSTTLDQVAELYQPKTISGNELINNGRYFVYGANGIIGKYDKYNHLESQIAVACRGASCGSLTMTLPKSWITGNAMIVNPTPQFPYKEYLYYTLCKKNIAYLCSGSAQPQLTRENMNIYTLTIPPVFMLENFEHEASSIRKKIIANELENIKLIQLRDWLLPMLMNGQATIND